VQGSDIAQNCYVWQHNLLQEKLPMFLVIPPHGQQHYTLDVLVCAMQKMSMVGPTLRTSD